MIKQVLAPIVLLRSSHFLSALATMSVATYLLHVLYLLYRGPDIPAVLWCGTTITDPLRLASNVFIPLGVCFHVSTLFGVYSKQHHLFFPSLIHSFCFMTLSISTVAVGIYYCETKLEGFSFCSLVWWLKWVAG